MIPGGSSVPILLPDQLDTQASFDGVQKAGSLLGSAGIIVLDDTTCMVWLAENLLHFYRHESCGKCTPCREGTDWLHKILRKIERGEGQMRDLDLLSSISGNIGGKTLCAFGDAAVTPVLTTLKHFRHEYEAHIREGRCTLPADWRARQPVGCALRWRRMLGAMTPLLAAQIGLTLFVFVMLLSSAAAMVYVERKVAALLQQRLGPYLVGPGGPAPAARRRHQADVQGGAAAGGGRQAALRAGADHLGDGGLRRVRGRAVRRRDDVLRPARRADAAAGRRRQRRGPRRSSRSRR